MSIQRKVFTNWSWSKSIKADMTTAGRLWSMWFYQSTKFVVCNADRFIMFVHIAKNVQFWEAFHEVTAVASCSQKVIPRVMDCQRCWRLISPTIEGPLRWRYSYCWIGVVLDASYRLCTQLYTQCGFHSRVCLHLRESPLNNWTFMLSICNSWGNSLHLRGSTSCWLTLVGEGFKGRKPVPSPPLLGFLRLHIIQKYLLSKAV